MVTVISFRENTSLKYGDFITLQVQGELNATLSKRGTVVIDAPKAWVACGLNAAASQALVGKVLPIAGNIVKAKCEPFDIEGVTYNERNTFVATGLSSKKKALAPEEFVPST